MRARFIRLLFLGLLLLAPHSFAGETNQIMFLHVKLQNGVLTLVDSTVRPGLLKTHRGAPKRSLLFTVENAADQTLWESSMDDPLVPHLEDSYPKTGELIPRPAPRTEAEFTIRVPVTKEMHHVSFYREEKIADSESGKVSAKSVHSFVGKVPALEPR